MNVTIPEPVEPVTPGDMGDELASFVRAMRANNVSPNTILAYSGAVRQFGQSLLRQDLPTDVDHGAELVQVDRHGSRLTWRSRDTVTPP